ncbi:hypothetical protein MKW98_012082 [Papaver atlanticum]|uniref:Uncharacterized protein n=1 Tax=Papaver atlanticum TaxID=357466 RepID=A0AAD4XXY6_9MAGN|nr:hypothetical protein MKW98_012082 [Papaver atlanticum]
MTEMHSDTEPNIRCAVVTGGNEGIGFENCRQLAVNTTGYPLEAVENLRNSFGLSNVVFHQLDVMNPITISSLAEFIRRHFGKLDILVNNAGISGVITDAAGIVIMMQALVKFISNEKALEILSDGDNLTEERVDESVNMFLKDFKEDSLETKGWPSCVPAYSISKVCLNAYTRICIFNLKSMFECLYKNLRKIISYFCVCPGWVKTDITYNSGVFTTAEGAKRVVNLALVPDDGPSGLYFTNGEVTPF